MKFGIVFFPTVGPQDKQAPRYFDEVFQLVDLAEKLGFGHVKVVEHSFSPYGGYSPDPVTFLAAAVDRTSREHLSVYDAATAMRLVADQAFPKLAHDAA